MTRLDSADITSLLKAWRGGDQLALDELMALVYDRLRAQARRHMRMERSGEILQTTALVHEVYLRLARGQDVDPVGFGAGGEQVVAQRHREQDGLLRHERNRSPQLGS